MSKTVRSAIGSGTSNGRLIRLLLFGPLFVIAVVFSSPEAIAKEHSVLDASDQIRVTGFGGEDLSGEVDARGWIGRVRGVEWRAGELETYIVTALLAGHLKNPRVNVGVRNISPILVKGEVDVSGSYPSSSGLTALKVMALAGGFTYPAKKNVLFVMCEAEQGEREIRADALARPGDAIRVIERYF